MKNYCQTIHMPAAKTAMQNHDHTNKYAIKPRIFLVYFAWLSTVVMLTVLMQLWLHRQYNPNPKPRVEIAAGGQQTVLLKRNRNGHYLGNGLINGQKALFLLDTGATNVVIPATLARDFQLDQGHPVTVTTANGDIEVYNTLLKTIELGPLRFYDVPANINPHMDREEVLLGMSFLKHLRFTQHQDELILSLP